MEYGVFQDLKLSRLGFGAMRLPTNADQSINVEKTAEMFDTAIRAGVNYFDTAWMYHGGESETVVGKILEKYPRDSFFLASKYPGFMAKDNTHPELIFEEQLRKCRVDHFDFYLLHSINEGNIDIYTGDEFRLLDYFLEQKRLGKIRHLGFSCHGKPDNLQQMLDYCGKNAEFVQLQINYLDWTLQDARKKYEMVTERGIPVWVMEPVRGGKLANLTEENTEKLKSLRPDESVASWAFRWLLRLPNVRMILSGMSDMEQVKDNLKTFSGGKPLSDEESDLLLELAERMKKSVPCTACRYCCGGCPKGLDIPMLLGSYNDLRFGLQGGESAKKRLLALDAVKLPSACVGCGACAKVCPQKIDIPAELKKLSKLI